MRSSLSDKRPLECGSSSNATDSESENAALGEGTSAMLMFAAAASVKAQEDIAAASALLLDCDKNKRSLDDDADDGCSSPSDKKPKRQKTTSSQTKQPQTQPTTGSKTLALPSVGVAPSSPSAIAENPFDMVQYMNRDEASLVHDLECLPMERLRMMRRTRMRELVELLYMTSRKKEAQSVLLEYRKRAPAVCKSIATQNPQFRAYSSQRHSGIDSFAHNIERFIKGLDVKWFRDQREVDYPLNTKRISNKSEREGVHKHKFRHRLLFEGSKRELVLTYCGALAFTIKAYDIEPEEALRLRSAAISDPKKRALGSSATCLAIYMHDKGPIPDAVAAGGNTTASDRDSYLMRVPLIMYYFYPLDGSPRKYTPEALVNLNRALGSLIQGELFNKDGTDNKLTTGDVISVLLDVADIMLLDRTNMSDAFPKFIRTVTGMSRPREDVILPSLIGHETMEYVCNKRYMFVTGTMPPKLNDMAAQSSPAAAAATTVTATTASPSRSPSKVSLIKAL